MSDLKKSLENVDSQQLQEWLDSLDALIEYEGRPQAATVLDALLKFARAKGVENIDDATTSYVNTIDKMDEPDYAGDFEIEGKLRALIRWNAMAMVVKANKNIAVGGHIATFASSATLYEVGMNHFFKGPAHPQGADLIFFQGHCSPGIYARAFLEGRFDEKNLNKFRQEVDGGGISSYPHPWLMPEFWQVPTVSMGLGPLMAIYQARFFKYIQAIGVAITDNRKVWAFLGDGEMDEPESRGAIQLAAREKLDNLIFVVNCNLQRLDGPVRGNGKIVQELEGVFRGAGWQVIKVLWGHEWDELLERDTSGKLKQRMMEVVDGELQSYKAHDGAYIREHFFGKYPETAELVKDYTDEQIFKLRRGGHSTTKVHAAYQKAVNTEGRPTIILVHTVKGYGMGPYGEAANNAHSQKKLDVEGLKYFRDRFSVPISDEELEVGVPFYKPAKDSNVLAYMHKKREDLGGYLPARIDKSIPIKIPKLDFFDAILQSSGNKKLSTTMAFVRILGLLLRDKETATRLVPIIPDEARTFGMEGLFRQIGIYDPAGQLYQPVDAKQLMWYKESATGHVLEEGINEAGAMSSWIAAATSYANTGEMVIPFYIYYSMFGFQRIGDLVWAAGDLRARGFIIGATAGRTTLEGEGLQHQDGHNLLMFDMVPNCVSYDPTYAYELAVIIADGMQRMFADKEDVFYYITAMNENYKQPAMPKGIEEGIKKGIYKFRTAIDTKNKLQVNLLGSGTIFCQAVMAADLLKDDWGVDATLWATPSFNLLKRDGASVVRRNKLNPEKKPKVPYITETLHDVVGPFIAATDYIRDYANSVREFIPGTYRVLGTDGFGRSDTRAKLREHFEVNAAYIAFEALSALVEDGLLDLQVLQKAAKKYAIKADKKDPIFL